MNRHAACPAPDADAQSIALNIDGRELNAPPGASILGAARQAGIDIPTLCAQPSLAAFGSCRLCLVEIEGRAGYPAACSTPVAAGMRVRTQSPALLTLRRGVMELYLSDHPGDCLTCAASGDCELQTVAAGLGMRQARYGAAGASHLSAEIDDSNPYFRFDPARCIACSRCVRACAETQGSFALTLLGRGFDSRVAPAGGENFLASECVSCGACVAACPTAALMERGVIEQGPPDRSVATTCAYCGVGCSLNVELRGDRLIRLTPDENGGANHGHACVKGRFAWAYATHPDRVRQPLLRASIDDPWRPASWDEALRHAADAFRRIQAEHGVNAVGGIASSRCSNEEAWLVQKMMRAALGTNNVDTCARVCHAPTGFGLKQTLGESAGTQDFDSVDHADLVMVIGANPMDAHPVFASRLLRRLRQGARLIVIDPRRSGLLAAPHLGPTMHLAVRPGCNVLLLNAMANVMASEGLLDYAFIAERCDDEAFRRWRDFVVDAAWSPEAVAEACGVAAADIRAAARQYAEAGNAAIYYGLGVTEHSQGSTGVMAIANLAMACGQIGRPGVGVNPLRGQNNVQGACDMGSFPHEFPGYRHVSDPEVRAAFERAWGVTLSAEPGMRLPDMLQAARDGRFKGLYCQGEDIAQSDPDSERVIAALRAMECVVVQDLFLNETSRYAHVFLPGSSFLEKDGTFTNAERRISRVRQALPPLAGKQDWEITQALSAALGYPQSYAHPARIMDEIASLTPAFAGVSYALLDERGSVQWPCDEHAPLGTPILHQDGFSRGKGRFVLTPSVPSGERADADFPLLLTTGRALAQYNVGAQTRRSDNGLWLARDSVVLHPQDAARRGIADGDWTTLASRRGRIRLQACVSDAVPPGVAHATFHFPESGTNRLTSEESDWATGCPEYKLTAIEAWRAGDEPAAVRAEAGADGLARLERMANQIARSLSVGQPEADLARDVANHLRRFWSAAMRRELAEAARAGRAKLDAAARQALETE